MLTKKDYCDYETCLALKELGYNQPSIAFYPCQDIIVDCVDSNGELYEAEYYKGNLALYSSLNNKNHDINKVQAPLLYEAQKWLREEKKLVILVGFDFCPITSEIAYNWVIVVNGNTAKKSSYTYDYFEEALSEGLRKAVKILKEK